MRIALLGFELVSTNKGCEALSYSFLNMLSDLKIDNLEIHVFGNGQLGDFPQKYQSIKFFGYRLRMKRPNYWIGLKRSFASMDYIFDISFGDGFSDIYGKIWNACTDMAKQLAIYSKTPVIFLPQTYGPYKSKFLKGWALSLVKKANLVYARDARSAQKMNDQLGQNKVIEATDLAFALPYDSAKYRFEAASNRIGINVSSLLWDGGHAENIILKTNYQEYCKKIIEYLQSQHFEIHLIPHVVDKEHPDVLENDVRVCKILHDIYPETILAPEFDTPIDAKSYIANMNLFIGARMHSTIGAISSGVVTIPFSYSRKFEGLFDNLGYPYLITARDMTTEEALEKTIYYISVKEELSCRQKEIMPAVSDKLNKVKEKLAQLI